jgi:4-amino-4-deoxy-L-arabinose transferase-like glycosyltransferase
VLSVVRRWWCRVLPPVAPLDRRARLTLAAIVGVAAALRVVWALQVREPSGPDLHDPLLYLILGNQLAEGHGYTYPTAGGGVTAYYPPGYPLLLGAAIWLVRLVAADASAFDVALWTNVVLSVALVGLFFALGRRLGSTPVGLVAAAVAALWPNLVFHSGVVLTETLFLAVLVAMFLVALATPDVARRPGWRRVTTVGVLFGLSVLVRPVSLVIAPLFLVLWWGDGARRATQRTALALGVMVLVVLPWSILSTIRMESPVLLSLNFGDNFCIGNNPDANGAYALYDYCFQGLQAGERPEAETHRQAETIDRALRFIRDEPATALGLVDDRARYTLRDDHDGLFVASDWGERPLFVPGRMDLLEQLADGYYYAVVAASIAGVAVLLANRRLLAGAGSAWLFFVLTAPVQLVSPLVTFGEPRFKMPMYPVLAVLAAVAVVTVARRGRWLQEPTPQEPGVSVGGQPRGPGRRELVDSVSRPGTHASGVHSRPSNGSP